MHHSPRKRFYSPRKRTTKRSTRERIGTGLGGRVIEGDTYRVDTIIDLGLSVSGICTQSLDMATYTPTDPYAHDRWYVIDNDGFNTQERRDMMVSVTSLLLPHFRTIQNFLRNNKGGFVVWKSNNNYQIDTDQIVPDQIVTDQIVGFCRLTRV